jgi:hypothetical protein
VTGRKMPQARRADPPVTINVKITLPQKAVWVMAGFMAGVASVAGLPHVLAALHGS